MAVPTVLRQQRETGLDVVNEGEYAKGGDWLSYLEDRFGGFEQQPRRRLSRHHRQGKDREEFADFYDMRPSAARSFDAARGRSGAGARIGVCTGRSSIAARPRSRARSTCCARCTSPVDVFLTAAPASIEAYRQNEFYKSEEEFVFALAEAMRTEYEVIAEGGLPAAGRRRLAGGAVGPHRHPDGARSLSQALHAAGRGAQPRLRATSRRSIRYHLCWGSWHGPHAHDLEMIHVVDIMLKVKAQAYLFEAANARHEHEYAVWETVKLPAGKIIVPGVVTHSTDIVEHPELVSQRIQRSPSWSGARTSLPAPIAASAGARIRRSPGPSCARWWMAPSAPRARSGLLS